MPKGKKIVWTDDMIREAVSLYEGGLPIISVAERMGLTRTPVRNLLLRKTSIRSLKSAARVSFEQGRHFAGVAMFTTRLCRICKNEFRTRACNAFICNECAPPATRYRARAIEYGLSKAEYDRMLDEQNGLCAICQQKDPACIDHDHKTGEVRGLLCHGCNIGVGHIEKENDWLSRALTYLSKERS